MADNKKSFILYCDYIHMFKKMPDDLAGKLIKHVLEYVNDNNPTTKELMVDVLFEPIKQQLKRDLQKYENVAERNRSNGAKGGRPKKHITQNNPVGLIGNPNNPEKPDTDTDTDTDTDNVNNKNKIEASQIKNLKGKILSEVEQKNIISKAKAEVENRGGKWVCDYNFNPYDVLSKQFNNWNKICVDGKYSFNDVNHIKNVFYKFVVEYWEFNYDAIISKRKTKFKKQYNRK